MTMISKIACIVLGLVLTGCGTHRESSPLDLNKIDPSSSIVITQMEGFEKPTVMITGNVGLLEYGINSAMMSTCCDEIEKMDLRDVLDTRYYSVFERALTKKQFTVVAAKSPLIREELSSPPEDTSAHAPYDFRKLKDKYSADFAFVLAPRALGISRNYHGPIPLGRPSGHSSIDLYVVNLRDNTLAGVFTSDNDAAIHGEWDTPPDYRAAKESVRSALTSSLEEAFRYLMNPGS